MPNMSSWWGRLKVGCDTIYPSATFGEDASHFVSDKNRDGSCFVLLVERVRFVWMVVLSRSSTHGSGLTTGIPLGK